MDTVFKLLKTLFGASFLEKLLNYLVQREDFQAFAVKLIMKPAKKLDTTNHEVYVLLEQYVEQVVKVPAVFTDENQDNAAQVVELFKLKDKVAESKELATKLEIGAETKAKALKLKV